MSSYRPSHVGNAIAAGRAQPFHTFLTGFLLFSVVILLAQNRTPVLPEVHYEPLHFDTRQGSGSSDLTLRERLQRSERLFIRSKERRNELRAKFGSNPVPYPPDKRPFPAYTCRICLAVRARCCMLNTRLYARVGLRVSVVQLSA